MSDLRWTILAAVREALGPRPQSEEELGRRTGLGLPGAEAQRTLLGGALRWLQDAGCAGRDGDGWVALRGARVTRLPLALMQGVREPLSEALVVARAPRGWSKAKLDVASLLAAVPTLRLRPDHTLIGYVWRDGSHGAGAVWAVPSHVGHPGPDGLPRVDKGSLAVPKPPGAHADLLAAFELDGTPAAHAHAWLLRRELDTFGAVGAESDWPFHVLVDRAPWAMGLTGYITPSPAGDWTWVGDPPAAALEPTVEMSAGGRITLTVHTWAFLNQERLVRHVVRQQQGGALVGEQAEVLGTSRGALVL